MLPIHVGSISERSDFEKLDIDMSGTISIDEFITGGFSLGDSFEEIDRVWVIYERPFLSLHALKIRKVLNSRLLRSVLKKLVCLKTQAQSLVLYQNVEELKSDHLVFSKDFLLN